MKKTLKYGGLTIIALVVCYFAYSYWEMRQIQDQYLEEVSEELGFDVDRESLTQMNEAFDMINQSLAADKGYETERLDLKGRWYLNKWELYHTLDFETEMDLVIDNHIDTIFRYRYMLSNDTLWLGNKEQGLIANKIEMFTNDTLIFANLLDKQDQLIYIRTEIK